MRSFLGWDQRSSFLHCYDTVGWCQKQPVAHGIPVKHIPKSSIQEQVEEEAEAGPAN